ncbi:MAG: hypothetical protein ACJ761_11445, partial [Chloroflexota bacterium]
MTGGASRVHSEPGLSLPVLDRLAPRPPDGPVSTWVERHTAPGDIVADPFGRGGWVARAALDHERRAVSLEIGPLQRMLAEIVLRPPDVRHLDAAVQGLATASHGRSSLKSWIEDLFATRCASCGRTLVVDAFTWVPGDEAGASARPISKRYRCGVCRDQQGGRESREAPLDADDLARAGSEIDHAAVRAGLLERFPPIDGAPSLPAELLDLHSPRQLAALAGILERIEGELRAAPVLAVLRLALLHAILPASRLATGHGRVATLRSVGGHVRHPAPGEWRERNPWLAYEEAFRTVRGFVQRLEGGATGPPPARLGEDLRSLGETVATAVLGLTAGAGSLLSAIDAAGGPNGAGAHVRLVIGQPPPRPTLDRIALAYHGTAWVLGREAAGLVPAEALAGSSLHPSWGRQADAVRAALERIEPATSPDARAVLLLDDGPEPLVAAALGATAAGYRLLSARIADP